MEQYRIPTSVNQFDVYQESFSDLITKNAADWGIPATTVTKLTALRNKWAPAYKLQADEYTASKANKITRDTVRKEYETEIKNIIEQYLLNKPTIADDKKGTIGIKTRKPASSTKSVSKGHPVIQVRINGSLAHSIVFRDSIATASKAKPKGVAFCELRYKIVETGTPPPVSSEEFTGYEFISSSGRDVLFPEAYRGKTAHYFARWRRTDGSTGPWSAFTDGGIIG